MSQNIAGIHYLHFYDDDLYQLWAFSLSGAVASEVQEAFDADDWPQVIIDDIETDFGTLDFASSPCDDVHGVGLYSSEIPFSKANAVMTAWRDGIAEALGDEAELGEVLMLQEGHVDDTADFSTDHDIYRLYTAA